ncbi:NADH-quinone oxidoreductase subunit C [Candidatus Bathyarchaeota archaeon]|nr:MAG: NADH-quinone oxidoreductase subunit C [Candidatus Bathyarchaeota archaeon]
MTEAENEILEKVKETLKEEIVEIKIPRKRRIFVKIRRKALKQAVKSLKELGFKHISTITGVDLGENIELIYHFAYKGAVELSLRLDVPKNKPDVPTITDIIPGAILYEREVHDLFGVTFEGHPQMARLILPEKWPEGIYPLRKEYTLENLKKLIFEDGEEE